MPPQFILTPWTLDQATPALEALARPGWRVNGVPAERGTQQGRIAAVHAELARHVGDTLKEGGLPVSVAGDCCAALPVLAGLQAAGLHPVVVWLDAHGDFNTPATTISGFLGGMPLAMISGRGDQSLMQAAGAHLLLDDDIILSDARDLDPLEAALLHGSGVHHLDSVDRVPERLPPHRPVYVHLDFDIMQPADAPAMRYSVPGGPTLDQLKSLGRAIRGTGRLAAVSATTWDLGADSDGRTGKACMEVLGAFVE
jgi:arginase